MLRHNMFTSQAYRLGLAYRANPMRYLGYDRRLVGMNALMQNRWEEIMERRRKNLEKYRKQNE